MEEHSIPQNIMDYEFKLFAGLSLRQFIFVAVTIGASYTLFQLNALGVLPTLFAWILIPLVVIIGLGLGLGSIQKRPIEEWVTHFFRIANTPLRRVWKKDQKPVKFEDMRNTKPVSFPDYLSVYFLSADEYAKLATYARATDPIPAQQSYPISPTIVLDATNVMDYADPTVTLPALPNTVAFRIIQDGLPVEGVICYVKDMNGNVVTALSSNEAGILYFDQSFPNGQFEFELQSDTATLPKLNLSFEGFTYPLINIAPTL